MTYSIALIGARGYVGRELLALINKHPELDLSLVSSRHLEGKPVSSLLNDEKSELKVVNIDVHEVNKHTIDCWILALPDGLSYPWIEAISHSSAQSTIIDLSSDNRFNSKWSYGLPELNRHNIRHSKRISNPGCYATGMQLAIRPFVDRLNGTPICFGVSGYSGAGTKPSDKNDLRLLENNLLAYQQNNHVHEQEVSYQLNHKIRFMPHVANFFRGLHLSIDLPLDGPIKATKAYEMLTRYYAHDSLIRITQDIPRVASVATYPYADLGGISMNAENNRLCINVCLDNLLKGAAVQALQNINLAYEFDELTAILKS